MLIDTKTLVNPVTFKRKRQKDEKQLKEEKSENSPQNYFDQLLVACRNTQQASFTYWSLLKAQIRPE